MQEQAGKQAKQPKNDEIFTNIVEKKGYNPEHLIGVYQKCKDEFVKLYSHEYHIGSNLQDMGLIETWFKPIWVNGSYRGQEVFFKSVIFER